MSKSFEVSRALIEQAMQAKGVREACEKVAGRVAQRARGIAASEGVKMDVKVVSGVRPGGRPYANVVGDNVAQEWGGSKTVKRRILGRAAEEAK